MGRSQKKAELLDTGGKHESMKESLLVKSLSGEEESHGHLTDATSGGGDGESPEAQKVYRGKGGIGKAFLLSTPQETEGDESGQRERGVFQLRSTKPSAKGEGVKSS